MMTLKLRMIANARFSCAEPGVFLC